MSLPDVSSPHSSEGSSPVSEIEITHVGIITKPPVEVDFTCSVESSLLNNLIQKECDFFVGCQLKPRWYYLNFNEFPFATCYPRDYLSFQNRVINRIPRFTQNGLITFASIRQEVATIQAHESAGWHYIEEGAVQRCDIMKLYVRLLQDLREHKRDGFSDHFWGYRLYTYGLQ